MCFTAVVVVVNQKNYGAPVINPSSDLSPVYMEGGLPSSIVFSSFVCT